MVNIIVTRYELRKHMNEAHEGTKQSSRSTEIAGQLEGKRGQQKLENKCIPTISKKGKGKNVGDGDLEEQCNKVTPKRGRRRKNYNEMNEEAENNEGRKKKNYNETNEEDENKEHENAKGPEEVGCGSKSLKSQNRRKKKGCENYDSGTNILNETLVMEGENVRAAEGLVADLVGGEETKTNKEDKVKRRGRKRREEKNVSNTSIETLMVEEVGGNIEEEEEEDVSLGARKAKRRRKREDRHAGDLTLSLEESLIGDVVDKEEEEKEEELVELMASNVFWDKGKQERFEQISAEDQETNKQNEDSLEISLAANEAGSDWHSSCKRIISRSRKIKYIFVTVLILSLTNIFRFNLKDLNLRFDKTSFSKKVTPQMFVFFFN